PAEDGMRALHVTGVQTCALPILRRKRKRPRRPRRKSKLPRRKWTPPKRRPSARRTPVKKTLRERFTELVRPATSRGRPLDSGRRSAERRVGRERRARGTK